MLKANCNLFLPPLVCKCLNEQRYFAPTKAQFMSANLVIVESPAKAKTIEGYLGKDFKVMSSYGHICDLPKGQGAVDVEAGFEPKYTISKDKEQLVRDLKKAAKAAKLVWLATDEDREGEAISWHLKETLGLADEKIRRIVFHEITKPAILRAIENPRTVDEDLVNAQQARRILDRLVGFELSPVLWRKVKPQLSAGRVQSVAVRILVEREREIRQHTSVASFRVVGEFLTHGIPFKATLNERFDAFEDARNFLESALHSTHSVKSIDTKPTTRKPAAPFTTSTLQQEAARKLGFSVSRTMKVAQDLYEAGHITYMRTDSTNLSETALEGAEAAIKSSYGADYHLRQTYSKAAKGAQEAHEAILPTDFTATTMTGDRDLVRLYELIWKRSIASQMAHAQLENTTAHIDVSGRPEHFVAKGQVITFDGFLKVYLEGTDDENTEEHDKDRLPSMEVGQALDREGIVATERFSKHLPRYTEASLVKRLEELGIGRPSTYAPTISTVQKRGYVEKRDLEGTPREYRVLEIRGSEMSERTETEMTGADRNKLIPTDIGSVVNDFLHEHFENILDFNFTANVENEFDHIAQGELNWRDMLKDFYKPFKSKVDEVIEVGERPKDRVLGEDPKSGKPIIVRIGRFGPIAQIGDANDEEKQFASLLKDQSIETITLEQALELFKLPRRLGEHEGKVVTAAIGRFGPYVRYDGKFVSLKAADGDDPHTITLTRALELIQAKIEADAKALIKVFDEDPDTRILNGRYGPYIKHGKKNVTIPKTEDPMGIDWARALELIEEHAKKPKRGRRKS